MLWIIRCGLWAAMAALSSVLGALGLPIVGWLAWRRAWVRGLNSLGRGIWVWGPRWAWLWSDSDQGVYPGMLPGRWTTFVWSGIRNKASNLRFLPPFGFQVDPKRIRFRGNDRNLYLPLPNDSRPVLWSLTWQGLYAGLWVIWRGRMQLRIGWTLVPDDALGFNPRDLRQVWCGFSIQLNRGT